MVILLLTENRILLLPLRSAPSPPPGRCSFFVLTCASAPPASRLPSVPAAPSPHCSGPPPRRRTAPHQRSASHSKYLQRVPLPPTKTSAGCPLSHVTEPIFGTTPTTKRPRTVRREDVLSSLILFPIDNKKPSDSFPYPATRPRAAENLRPPHPFSPCRETDASETGRRAARPASDPFKSL